MVLANRLPFPLDDGWKIRAFHVLRGLTAGADVTLVSFHDGDARIVDELRAAVGGPLEIRTVPAPRLPAAVQVVLGLVTPDPLHVWKQRSRALRKVLGEVGRTRAFDVAVVEVTAMYRYLDQLPRAPRRILDAHNIDSLVLRRYAGTLRGMRRRFAALTARKYERFERAVFATADLTWVCSDADRRALTRLAPAARVAVVPNGFDPARVAPPRHAAPHPQRLMFCGLMNYHPNVDAAQFFAERMLPDLKRAVPGIEFWIVGRSPARAVLALAARDPAIRVTGRVDDVAELLASAAVVVVPLRAGGGTRLKILEALAMGKAVVTTSVGMEGLEVVAERDLLVADTPAAFQSAVLRLLGDPAQAARVGRQGQATVLARYQWARIEEGLRNTLGWTAPCS